MAFKDGAVLGALTGAGLWYIFRTIEWLGNFNTWFSQYQMQTFVIMSFVFAIVGGIITWK